MTNRYEKQRVAIYTRVSTLDKEQNPKIQEDAIKGYCLNLGLSIYMVYTDYASATDLKKRVRWFELLQDAQKHRFDVLMVWKLDRAFRDTGQAINTLNDLNSLGIDFKSLTDGMDTTTAMGRCLFAIMAAFAELENANLSERVRAGMAYAKTHGTRSGNGIGRKCYGIPLISICKALQTHCGSQSAVAKDYNVSPGYVSLRLKRAGLPPAQQLIKEAEGIGMDAIFEIYGVSKEMAEK